MTKYQAIDCFAGAGGLSLGLAWAGVDVVAAFDNDPKAVATYEKNLGAHILEGDAREFTASGLLSEFNRTAGEIALVVGGPPCQGFSVQRRGGENDPRNELVFRFMSFVEEVMPKAFVSAFSGVTRN